MNNVYVFSDESGVLDNKHYDYFVYAGMIIIGKQELDSYHRRYIALEKKLRMKSAYKNLSELKGYKLADADRAKLMAIFSDIFKFALVIKQEKVRNQRIYATPRFKQQYLTTVYRYCLKCAINKMISSGLLPTTETTNIFINEDNYKVAPDILKEMEKSMLDDFKYGYYDPEKSILIPPLFKKLETVSISLKESEANALIRGADIIAHTVYSALYDGSIPQYHGDNLFHIEFLP